MVVKASVVAPVAAVLVLALSFCAVEVQGATGLNQPVTLTWHYYRDTCRYAEVYVRHQVQYYYKNDPSIAPKLLRLLFSDCFVTGCDASILLDGPNSEKTALQNRGLGAFVLIDKIKTVLEDRCPGIVSCADILNLATRDAVHLRGAPSYPVFTGRRDGMTSSADSVDIPSPSMSVEQTLAYFKSKGLDVLDTATLLGAHSMGRTHCSFIVDRLYNYNNTGKPDPTMDKSFLKEMRELCPPRTEKGQTDPLVHLNPDSGNGNNFTNSFYARVLKNKAVLGVDQQLLFNEDTKQISEEFLDNFEDFRLAFALSMSRMGSIGVLTGDQGEIRKNCRFTNKNYSN